MQQEFEREQRMMRNTGKFIEFTKRKHSLK